MQSLTEPSVYPYHGSSTQSNRILGLIGENFVFSDCLSSTVTILQSTAATNGEPFEISSTHPDEEPSMKHEINHIDTTDEFSTSDSENISTPETTKRPEGKMFQFDGHGYRGEQYGRGGDYGPRQGYGYGPRRHHQDHGHKKEEDVHVSVPYIDRNGQYAIRYIT